MRALSYLLLATIGAACTAAHTREEPPCGDGECISCADAHTEVLRTLADWSDPHSCVADSDCVAVTESLVCPENGTSFDNCAVVMHAASREAYAAAAAETMAAVCPRIEDPCVIS